MVTNIKNMFLIIVINNEHERVYGRSRTKMSSILQHCLNQYNQCVISRNGVSVPSIGTWKLVCIHGQYKYDDDTLEHWVDFLGTSLMDSVRSKDTVASEVQWNYDDLLGADNYSIATTLGTYLNEYDDISSTTYSSEFNLNNGTATYGGKLTSHDMTISNRDSKGINCAVRVLITDLCKVTVSDDGLSFEYQRTA